MELQSERMPEISIRGSYAFAWQQVLKNFLFLFLISLFILFAESPISFIQKNEFDGSAYSALLHILAMVYGFLLFPVFKYGADFLYVQAMRNESLEVEVLVRGFRENYFHIILAHLLVTALVVIGLIFLIIPGIIIACRLVFVSYLVMDKGLDPVAAIEKSWDMTRGKGWKIFGMALLAIPVLLLGLLVFCVGIFFAGMWISGAFAALYHAIDKENLYEDDPYLVRE